MAYLIIFLEGITVFISPCILPMLPLYVSYFSGCKGGGRTALRNALGFVLGFTLLFVAMGAFAGVLGSLLVRYSTVVNLIGGGIIVLFGLHYLGVLRIGLLNRTAKMEFAPEKLRALRFPHAVLFGVVFAVGWTPCVGPFLGSALMMAASSGGSLTGVLLLFCFSLGLGIPFVVSALLIQQMKAVLGIIKRNYRVVNAVSGCLLILVGVAMMGGLLGRLLSVLTF